MTIDSGGISGGGTGTSFASLDEKVNILIVDDRPDKLLALKTALEELKENIVLAHSGSDALRCLLRQEFAVILPGSDVEGAADVAERVRGVLAERSLAAGDGVPIHLTASFGVAASAPGMTAEALVEAADDALYQAKRAGKDRVRAKHRPVASA